MSRRVTTFAQLIPALAEKYHGGSFNQMSKRLGTAPALVYQWKDGLIHRPSPEKLERLCRAYGLDRWDVEDLISRKPGAHVVVGALLAIVAAFGALSVPTDASAAQATYKAATVTEYYVN